MPADRFRLYSEVELELVIDDMARQAALLLERHFVRVALERNHDDSDAAAQMLGIPRQRLDGHGNGDPSSPAGA